MDIVGGGLETTSPTHDPYDPAYVRARVAGKREPDPVYAWPADYALLIFAPNNPLRMGCEALYKHWLFDNLIILLIVVSSICLAIDSPRLEPDSQMAWWLKQFNVAFTWIFGFECAGDTGAMVLDIDPVADVAAVAVGRGGQQADRRTLVWALGWQLQIGRAHV